MALNGSYTVNSDCAGTASITLDIPVTVNGAMERSHVRGKINGGGELLEISTGDGSIHVGKL